VIVVWFTGLPSSGKTTLARAVRDRLRERGRSCLLFDGDEVRAQLAPPPGYDEKARDAFYHTLANLAALCARQGTPVLVAATAHRRQFRQRARAAAPAFLEVFVAATVEECRRRDAKGLWANPPPDFPGPDVYQPPRDAAVVAAGGHDVAARDRIVELILQRTPPPSG
jgi:adenylylsulfate kinase